MEHYYKLRNMYLSAPVQKVHEQLDIEIEKGKCKITSTSTPNHFHAGNTLHGAFYFKLLDDAAYFAAASLCLDHFLLTLKFETSFFRPVSEGLLEARGFLVEHTNDVWIAKSELFFNGKLAAKGQGEFKVGNVALSEISSYKSIRSELNEN